MPEWLPSWTKPHTPITLIAAIVLVIGFVLFNFWPEMSYISFSLVCEIILFTVIIDRLLLRGEREYWRSVDTKVKALIKVELTRVFLSVAESLELVHELDDVIGLDKRVAAEMKELAENPAKLRKAFSGKLSHAGLASFNSLSDRAKELGDLQLRYSSRFLERELLGLMIDLETSLRTVCFDTSIAATRGIFVELNRDIFFNHLAHLLGLLSRAVYDGRIDSPSLMS